MFEVKEIFRVREIKDDGILVQWEVYNSERKRGPLQKLLKRSLTFNSICIVPRDVDKTAHTAQMIADALNMKLATAMSGVATDDPWQMPVPLEHKE